MSKKAKAAGHEARKAAKRPSKAVVTKANGSKPKKAKPAAVVVKAPAALLAKVKALAKEEPASAIVRQFVKQKVDTAQFFAAMEAANLGCSMQHVRNYWYHRGGKRLAA